MEHKGHVFLLCSPWNTEHKEHMDDKEHREHMEYTDNKEYVLPCVPAVSRRNTEHTP